MKKETEKEKEDYDIIMEYYCIMKNIIKAFIPDADLETKNINKGFIFQKINHYLNKILSNLKNKVLKLKSADRQRIYTDIFEIIQKYKNMAKKMQIPSKKEIETLNVDMMVVKSLLHQDFQIDEGIDIEFSKQIINNFFNKAYSKVSSHEFKIPEILPFSSHFLPIYNSYYGNNLEAKELQKDLSSIGENESSKNLPDDNTENHEVCLDNDLLIDTTQNSATADESIIKSTKDLQKFINYQLEINKEQKQISEMLIQTINKQNIRIKELENKLELYENEKKNQ